MLSLYRLGRPSLFSHMMREMDRDFNMLERSVLPYWNSANPSDVNVGQSIGEVTNSADKFSVSIDVSHFKPEDLKVEMEGNQLCIEGTQEEKTETGYTKRSFVRRFVLPEEVDLSSLRSSLNDKGQLCVEAPKKTTEETKKINIPIQPAVQQ